MLKNEAIDVFDVNIKIEMMIEQLDTWYSWKRYNWKKILKNQSVKVL